ncbi:RNA polymerase sigma factor [Lentiprolixibacter aurantiacus]|uniref:Sigma-70 family RNA polymerase sigma factor n=1 Tax=Lentiprolixibacter aurantiacus TaxID=2993939 RepID=A0AAE3MM58_9FLAO|nr:sigma-70 family RNA polymerase sigma factor [Lentiprolixibacter aurantiacus]MCX2720335.1 sigma-70 family RNA polymerase sigma factor [Lentiprolixibacter aurantiacus]
MEKDLLKEVCEEHIYSGLYEKLAQGLHDFLYYKYGQNLNPDDKVQEAFIKLWENCKKVSLGKARSFLYTVANNLMLNEIKHQKVVLNYQNQKPRNYTRESPEFLMEQDEYFKRYQEVLSKLSEEQRTAFMLNKVEGKKHEEIAEVLGVTRKVVEYRIYSAFKVLREELEGFRIK